MAHYDQLAFSSRPSFYLASPSTADQSGGGITVSSNTLVLSGQPIIYGHSTSFNINPTSSLALAGDPFFVVGSTVEFILNAQSPNQEVDILSADNGNGVFLSQNGILLRVMSISAGISKAQTCIVNIGDWYKKLHVVIHIGSNSASLTVNGVSATTVIDGDVDNSATAVKLGDNFYNGYFFLLDGLGIYSSHIADKAGAIDDPGSGHTVYAAKVYNGQTTLFSTYEHLETVEVPLANFYNDVSDKSFIYSHYLENNDLDSWSLLVKSNDDALPINYDFSGGPVNTFYNNTVINYSTPGIVSFKVMGEVPNDFVLKLQVVKNADIETSTPANLVASGTPIFPDTLSEEISNCPEGVNLDGISYSGTWIASEFQATNLPKTIELVFRPKANLGPNLLSNPGFETGTAPWFATRTTFIQDNTQVHSGMFAAKVTPNGSGGDSYITTEQVPVSAGESYIASLWVWLTTAVTGGFTCSIDWYDVNHNYLSTNAHGVSVNAGVWTFLSNTFVAPVNAVYADISTVLTGNPPATNIFYVDDVSLSQVILNLGDNMLSNPGFEMGSTPWIVSNGTLIQDSTQVHSGMFAARVTPSGTGTQSYISSEKVPITAGASYMASSWVWLTASVTNSFTCSMDWYDTTGAYLSTNSNAISVNASAWNFVSNPFVAPVNAAYARVSVVLSGSPPATNIFYVDDVSLSKMGSTVIFSSSDGSIGTVSQSGYTMWLNGVSVSNLANLRLNQWNHLVLTLAAPAASSFVLNSGLNKIDYLFLSSYANLLADADIQLLYKIVSGTDAISVTEASVTISEGAFDDGQAFATFSLSWSIVGAGGS